MVGKLEGQVAVVTGAARGIGLAIAQRLAHDGALVVMTDVDDGLEEAASQLRDQQLNAQALRLDVTQESSITDVIGRVMAGQGRIDILVNNAGISPKKDGGKFLVEETSTADWGRVLAVNLTGPFLMSREVIPYMRKAGRGRIVNITSQAGRARPEATSGHYSASKAGLTGLSRAMANELGSSGITVNCVAPGAIETPMMANFSAEKRAHYASRAPVGILGQPADIAGAVSFLASDEGRYITGATIDVNGGTFMT